MISVLADFHFAPTLRDAKHLYHEGVPRDRVVVSGNTVVDALQLAIDQDVASEEVELPMNQHLVLITLHRRESWAFEEKQANRTVIEGMLAAIRDVANDFADIHFIFRQHPNPKVRAPAARELGQVKNVQFIEPVPSYSTFVRLLGRMSLVVTDSGGIQEEAPALGVPVLVLREKTERMEALISEGCKVVGTSEQDVRASLIAGLTDLRRTPPAPARPIRLCSTPIGDGRGSERIRDALLHFLRGDVSRPKDFSIPA
jgi:UDP-N-acetylglucosamine 2-epimerase (non-hydrolysing)